MGHWLLKGCSAESLLALQQLSFSLDWLYYSYLREEDDLESGSKRKHTVFPTLAFLATKLTTYTVLGFILGALNISPNVKPMTNPRTLRVGSDMTWVILLNFSTSCN